MEIGISFSLSIEHIEQTWNVICFHFFIYEAWNIDKKQTSKVAKVLFDYFWKHEFFKEKCKEWQTDENKLISLPLLLLRVFLIFDLRMANWLAFENGQLWHWQVSHSIASESISVCAHGTFVIRMTSSKSKLNHYHCWLFNHCAFKICIFMKKKANLTSHFWSNWKHLQWKLKWLQQKNCLSSWAWKNMWQFCSRQIQFGNLEFDFRKAWFDIDKVKFDFAIWQDVKFHFWSLAKKLTVGFAMNEMFICQTFLAVSVQSLMQQCQLLNATAWLGLQATCAPEQLLIEIQFDLSDHFCKLLALGESFWLVC